MQADVTNNYFEKVSSNDVLASLRPLARKSELWQAASTSQSLHSSTFLATRYFYSCQIFGRFYPVAVCVTFYRLTKLWT